MSLLFQMSAFREVPALKFCMRILCFIQARVTLRALENEKYIKVEDVRRRNSAVKGCEMQRGRGGLVIIAVL